MQVVKPHIAPDGTRYSTDSVKYPYDESRCSFKPDGENECGKRLSQYNQHSICNSCKPIALGRGVILIELIRKIRK